MKNRRNRKWQTLSVITLVEENILCDIMGCHYDCHICQSWTKVSFIKTERYRCTGDRKWYCIDNLIIEYSIVRKGPYWPKAKSYQKRNIIYEVRRVKFYDVGVIPLVYGRAHFCFGMTMTKAFRNPLAWYDPSRKLPPPTMMNDCLFRQHWYNEQDCRSAFFSVPGGQLFCGICRNQAETGLE